MDKIKKETILYIVVMCLYAILTVTLGIFHEPWADEAQAWLISRDTPLSELIPVLQYEGHPLVWFLILKVLNFIHYPYDKIFIIPLMFSLIGVWLFLFRSKFPVVLKVLFPFTWFIFYQYSIIARNHSIVFPTLAFIAVLYKDRLKHPVIYSLSLIFLANISAYSFVIAFVLVLSFLFDIAKNKKIDFKALVPCLIAAISLILTILYMKKPSDCTCAANLDYINLTYFSLLYTISSGYFNTSNIIALFESQIPIIMYILAGCICCKSIRQILLYVLINLGLIATLAALYCNYWHTGYIFITFIFSVWILLDENDIKEIPFKKNVLFYVITVFLFSIQIIWSIKTVPLEINHDYSASKRVIEFLKENNLDKEKMLGIGHKVISLLPYYEENIYTNFKKTYYPYKKSDKKEHLKLSKILTPVIIVSKYNANGDYVTVLSQLKKYNKHEFNAAVLIKGEMKEDGTLTVYTLKN